MSIDARLDRLYPGLTAGERALLVLRAFKEDREEDWRVRSSMPTSQVAAFNRYIGLIRGVNHDLALVLIGLGERVAQVELKQTWLLTIVLFGTELEHVSDYLRTERPDAGAERAQRRASQLDEARRRLRRVIPGSEWPVDVDAGLPAEPDHERSGSGTNRDAPTRSAVLTARMFAGITRTVFWRKTASISPRSATRWATTSTTPTGSSMRPHPTITSSLPTLRRSTTTTTLRRRRSR